jgi:hypothetical protein
MGSRPLASEMLGSELIISLMVISVLEKPPILVQFECQGLIAISQYSMLFNGSVPIV